MGATPCWFKSSPGHFVIELVDQSGRMHPSELSDEELLRQCEVTTLRRGGPGGQHRNKVETAVVVRYLPTGVVAEANERRSQAENRRVALVRLRLELAVAVRGSSHLSETASQAWQAAVVSGRLNVSARSRLLPQLLAELLDWLESCDFDLHSASERFQVTPSQLVKLLRQHPPALRSVNAQRDQRGLGSLR